MARHDVRLHRRAELLDAVVIGGSQAGLAESRLGRRLRARPDFIWPAASPATPQPGPSDSDRDPVGRAIFRWGFRKSLAIGAAIHECGGARMGKDPARSVLNEFNQSWDAPN